LTHAHARLVFQGERKWGRRSAQQEKYQVLHVLKTSRRFQDFIHEIAPLGASYSTIARKPLSKPHAPTNHHTT
jgi:hypothetical protein